MTHDKTPNQHFDDGDQLQRKRSILQLLIARPEVMIIAALVVIVLVFVGLRPEAFLSTINMRNMAVEASVMMILAVGMTFVIVTAGIDLSIGAVLVFSGVCSVLTMRWLGPDAAITPYAGLAVALLTGLAWGIINGVLVAYARLTPLIVTLATMGIALGAARLLSGGTDLTGVPRELVNTIGIGRIWNIPVIFIIAIVFAVIAGVVLHKTRFGIHTFAIGSNTEGASRSGINVQRHLIAVYAISGLCAGLAAYLTLSRFASTTIAGHSLDNLKAITAVVLGGASLFGGTGTLFGTGIGVLIPVVLASGLVIVGLPSFWQEVAVGVVLLAAVFIDQLRRSDRT